MAVSIFWDCQNVRFSVDMIQLLLDFLVSKYGSLKHQFAYSDWTEGAKNFALVIHHLRFKCIHVASPEKNSVDNELIFDCKNYAHENRLAPIVVLISGDGDFVELVKYLKKEGKRVIVVGRQKTTSKKLIQVADEFHAIEAIFRCEQFAA